MRSFILMITAAASLSAFDIETAVYEAYNAGKKEVTIPPGVYRISPPSSHSSIHLYLTNMSDFTVNAPDVTMLCTETCPSIRLDNCSNVLIRGITVDYDPLPFTQGTVLSIGTNDRDIEIALHDGYPLPPEGDQGLYIYDRITRHWKKNMYTSGTSAKLTVIGRTVRGTTDGVNARLGIETGDLVVIKRKIRSPHVTFLSRSFFCTFDGVTLHTGPTFAVLDVNGGGNRYLGMRITPGPVPPGATEARLKANTADGIHVISSMPGPHIENCLIEGHSDDGIAIHGHYALVLRDSGTRITVMPKNDVLPFTTNSIVRFTRTADGSVFAQATVAGITPSAAADRPGYEAVKGSLSIENKGIRDSMKTYYEIDLDTAVNAAPGDGIDCPAKNGDGFIVRGNTIRNHRARGLLIKASDGIIENNIIDGSSIAGIVVAPELIFWLEAGNSWNLTIRSNVIRNSGYERSSTGSSQAGMISVIANGASGYAAPAAQRNIEIADNIVERCCGVNLLITAASNVTVRNNTFKDTHGVESRTGESRGVDTKAVVWLDRVRDVRFSNNKVERMGPFGGTFIGASDDIAGVTGAPVKSVRRILASKEFGIEQGANGWHYLSLTGSVFTAMKYNPARKSWEGPEQFCLVGNTGMHPGNNCDAVRRWTSTITGTVRITGKPASGGSDGVTCSIRKNDETIWTSPTVGKAGVSHAVSTSVKEGDMIYFIVNCGPAKVNSGDSTGWDPVIEIGK
ncbi:MAG: right-handed parallel beta-helix repeat-containing protein [Spirochaetota bacterium]